MLKEERYDKILEIINEETYTSAQNLAERLFVSLPTVRRDLTELQKRKLIVRSHGGAKKIDTKHTVLPTDFRQTLHPAEKRRICQAAASMVKDNSIVFIDASTTAFALVDFLDDKRGITVVTNSMPLSLALHKKHIKTYCTGGEVQSNSLGYAGGYAEEMIRHFNADVLFFSSFGVSAQGMIVDPSQAESLLRKTAAHCSNRVVFLCDHSKFGRSAPYNVMCLDEVDTVITNRENPSPILRALPKDKLVFA